MIARQHIVHRLAPFLKGIGQIMLQNNSLTGLCFLAGICWGSFIMGLAAVIAVCTGTFTAMLLKYPQDKINDGIYGFSAALVGVGLTCFFQPTLLIWIAIMIGSVLAAVIQHMCLVKKIPAFTFPFILVTWLFLSVSYYVPALIQQQPTSLVNDTGNYMSLLTHSVGQVIFQGHHWSGVFFIIGIAVNRPLAALYAIAGIALSALIAFLLKEPLTDIYDGLLSYNAVLCAITFSGKKKEDILMTLIAVVISVPLMILMRHLNLPALTFPFVLATWLVLLIKKVKDLIQPKQNMNHIT